MVAEHGSADFEPFLDHAELGAFHGVEQGTNPQPVRGPDPANQIRTWSRTLATALAPISTSRHTTPG
ncbi:hypothetical protein [Amycolatopsis sp. cmx-11-51]|uniref:hypothetical protein n=1 Tax=unclassified Amycolatopsis TaxID=2618356 RepID=UPI0039E58AAA